MFISHHGWEGAGFFLQGLGLVCSTVQSFTQLGNTQVGSNEQVYKVGVSNNVEKMEDLPNTSTNANDDNIL